MFNVFLIIIQIAIMLSDWVDNNNNEKKKDDCCNEKVIII